MKRKTAVTKAAKKKAPRKKASSNKKFTGAIIEITSRPSGAKVFVNGYDKGKTPGQVLLSSVTKEPKLYKFKVIKEGYLSWSSEEKLVKGDKKKYEINLKKKTGSSSKSSKSTRKR